MQIVWIPENNRPRISSFAFRQLDRLETAFRRRVGRPALSATLYHDTRRVTAVAIEYDKPVDVTKPVNVQ